MTRSLAAAAVAALLVLPSAVLAQSPAPPTPSATPITDAIKNQYNTIKGNILKSAEKVPDTLYSFQPTPEVRTFAAMFGHIADSNQAICGAAMGQKPTPLGAEKMTTKAQLVKALADSFAFCDKIINGLTEATAMEIQGRSPRVLTLAFNNSHNWEHYGNLVTYMRINKIVPPSSEPK